MPSHSWAVIYCPKEGSTHTHKRWKKIRSYLNEMGVNFDYVQSEGPGSVERLASMMTKSGYSSIIVVGGDSALNHALCGIMNTPSPTGTHPALGVIPNGFGNDFAKFWGFSSDNYKATINALVCHNTRKVDVGIMQYQIKEGSNYENKSVYFLNCVNLGIASAITNLKRRTSSLFVLKSLTYLISTLLLIFQRMSSVFEFSLSGEHIKQRAMGICIGSAHGYGQTPSAVPYNGLLDITLVSKPAIFQIFHGLWLLYANRFLSHKGIRVWRTKHIHFSSLGGSQVSVDGRVIHDRIQSIDVQIMPEEIDFLIP